jgi:chromosome segregation ATPase
VPEPTLEDLRREMQNLQREMRTGFTELRSEVTDLKSEVTGLKSEVTGLKSDVADLKSEVVVVGARVIRLPLIGSAIEVLQRDNRLLRAAINDLSRTNITAGEVEALHTDVDRALAGQARLEARIATLEQHTGIQPGSHP